MNEKLTPRQVAKIVAEGFRNSPNPLRFNNSAGFEKALTDLENLLKLETEFPCDQFIVLLNSILESLDRHWRTLVLGPLKEAIDEFLASGCSSDPETEASLSTTASTDDATNEALDSSIMGLTSTMEAFDLSILYEKLEEIKKELKKVFSKFLWKEVLSKWSEAKYRVNEASDSKEKSEKLKVVADFKSVLDTRIVALLREEDNAVSQYLQLIIDINEWFENSNKKHLKLIQELKELVPKEGVFDKRQLVALSVLLKVIKEKEKVKKVTTNR